MLPDAHALETALPTELPVGWLGDERVPALAVEQAGALKLYRLRGELFLQRRRNLDAVIDEQLLRLEAQRRGMPLAELEKSLLQTTPLTDAELSDFISRERAAGRAVENVERIRPYLEFQKTHRRREQLLRELRSQAQIEVTLRPPARPQLPVDATGGVSLGSNEGPLLIVFTNYECSICRATHRELDRLLGAPDPPRVVLRDFADHPVAMEAAALVRCAARTGRGAALRKELLRRVPGSEGKTWLSTNELPTVARLAGMTAAALRACTASKEIRARIEHDTQTARQLGFDEPPAFIAAGVPLSGMQEARQLEAALRGEWPLEAMGQR
ncbi:MAG: thioredoxin domain-containing protein [Steroidobacteraceae bacterium]